jgi:NAD(P)H-hydrate epimerase
MRLASVEQAFQIDEMSQKVYGLSAEVLMESAGSLAAREIDLTFLPELTRGSVAVVAGPGNNGGDALVVARHLHSTGYRDLAVYLIAPISARSPLFKIQLKRAQLQGMRIIDLEEIPERCEQIKSAELIVDGVFGIGLNRPIHEPYLRVIEAMNSSKAPKVSLDTPSGLNCNSRP